MKPMRRSVYVRHFTGTITRNPDGTVVIVGTGPKPKANPKSRPGFFDYGYGAPRGERDYEDAGDQDLKAERVAALQALKTARAAADAEFRLAQEQHGPYAPKLAQVIKTQIERRHELSRLTLRARDLGAKV